MLKLGEGRDASAMFEAHHPFTNRVYLERLLAKHQVDPAKVSKCMNMLHCNATNGARTRHAAACAYAYACLGFRVGSGGLVEWQVCQLLGVLSFQQNDLSFAKSFGPDVPFLGLRFLRACVRACVRAHTAPLHIDGRLRALR